MQSAGFFLLIFHSVAAFRNQWNTVDVKALQFIFGNVSGLDPIDFYNATSMEDIENGCDMYAGLFSDIDENMDPAWITLDTEPEVAKMNMTAQGCKDFFAHRIWVQKWADFLFRELTVDHGEGRLVLSPWQAAHLKSIFWYIDSKYHYIFSCTMYHFMESVANNEFKDVSKGIAFMQAVKEIQDQFFPVTFGIDDPKDFYLFGVKEQELRGLGASYFFDLANPEMIEGCTYISNSTGTDFSPTSWQNALTEMGLAKKK